MDTATAIAWWAMVLGSYVILWFLALFILLPIGLSDSDEPPGVFVPGAPVAQAKPPKISLRTKFLWASAIAGVVWLMLAGLVLAGVVQI